MNCKFCRCVPGQVYTLVTGGSLCDCCSGQVMLEGTVFEAVYLGLEYYNGMWMHIFKYDSKCPNCGVELDKSMFYCEDGGQTVSLPVSLEILEA